MFFRLGILNVRRQLTRSMLVIITLVLAAISLTNSLAMQKIPPLRVAPFLTRFTGGQIMVLPLNWAGQSTADVTGSGEFRAARLNASGMSWLEWFFPELYQGFWLAAGRMPTESLDRALLKRLAEQPGVEAVIASPMLPVVVRAMGNQGTVDYPMRIMPLTEGIVQLAADRHNPDQFALRREGLFFNIAAPMLKNKPEYKKQGQFIELLLPKLGENGTLDYGNPDHFEFPFAGYLTIPTREVYWADSLAGTLSEVGSFTGDIIWVGEDAWRTLVAAWGGEDSLPLNNLALKTVDLQVIDQTIDELSTAFPELTFAHMDQVEARIFRTGALELFRRAPRSVVQVAGQVGLVMPASFGRIFAYLLVLIAAILLGGHMLTGIAARNQEIGTLRALGARRIDIMILGVSETIALTVIGVTAGFLPMRLLGLIMQLRGGQPFLGVVGGFLTEYAQILSLTMAVSLLFALFPVWRLSSVAPMEVLRNE